MKGTQAYLTHQKILKHAFTRHIPDSDINGNKNTVYCELLTMESAGFLLLSNFSVDNWCNKQMYKYSSSTSHTIQYNLIRCTKENLIVVLPCGYIT